MSESIDGALKPKLRGSDFAKVISRSLYLQALFTAERQQGPGFGFAFLPVIRRLYVGGDMRGRALGRHLGFFGTHPVLVGYVLGVVARLEERRALGGPVEEAQAGEARAEEVKRALASALAALGDPLFWVTLRPLAGLIGILGMTLLPLADPSGPDLRVLACPLFTLLTYNAVAWPFRIAGVPRGYALADDPGKLLRSLRLAAWRRVLEQAGAFAFGALVALALAAMRESVDPLGRGPAHVATVLAPFLLGLVGAAAGMKRWPGRGVEIALAATLLALLASIRV